MTQSQRAKTMAVGNGQLPASEASWSPLRRFLRKTIHRLSFTFIYERRRTRSASAAGFRLSVPPTVFHPRWFLTSEFFADFISGLDLVV